MKICKYSKNDVIKALECCNNENCEGCAFWNEDFGKCWQVLFNYTIKYLKNSSCQEFAENIQEEISRAYDNNAQVMREHIDKHQMPDNEFMMLVTGKMNALRGISDYIDNLLKDKEGRN